jgi:hypothetical protein
MSSIGDLLASDSSSDEEVALSARPLPRARAGGQGGAAPGPNGAAAAALSPRYTSTVDIEMLLNEDDSSDEESSEAVARALVKRPSTTPVTASAAFMPLPSAVRGGSTTSVASNLLPSSSPEVEASLVDSSDEEGEASDALTRSAASGRTDMASVTSKSLVSLPDRKDGDSSSALCPVPSASSGGFIPSSASSGTAPGGGGGLLGALETARRRETRHIGGGNREAKSALSAKLSRDPTSSPVEVAAPLAHLRHSDLESVSSQLRRNAQYKQHGPGVALVLYVHMKFIAIGTSRGLILMFDHFQEIRQVIGSNASGAAQTVKTNASVSALDATAAGDILIAGYDNGEILLWDVAKGIVLKRLTEFHRQKVVRLKLIQSVGDGGAPQVQQLPGVVGSLLSTASQQASNSGDLAALSVDSDGIVHRIRFTKVIWTSYTIDNDCLLDGKSGLVVDLCVLPPVPSLSHFDEVAASMISTRQRLSGAKVLSAPRVEVAMFPLFPGTQWTAFNTNLRTYIVQVSPGIKVMHKVPAPPSAVDVLFRAPDSDEGFTNSSGVVSLDWTWFPLLDVPGDEGKGARILREMRNADAKGETVFVYPVLMRAWGKHVQFFTCSPASVPAQVPYGDAGALADSVDDVVFFQFGEYVASDVIIAAKWLSFADMKLVLVTFTHILILGCGSSHIEIEEKLSLLPSISVSLYDMVKERTNNSALLTSSVSSNSVYFILTSVSLSTFSLQSWVEQVNELVKEGKWLDALAKVLQEYKKKLQNSGMQTSDSVTTDVLLMGEEEEYLDAKALKETEVIDGYLKKYIDAMITRPHGSGAGVGGSSLGATSSRNQSQLVASVCIDYCVTAGRMKLLFNEVFSAFVGARQELHFLDAIEPFILCRKVTWLPPKIIGALLEMSARSHKLPVLERMLVHIDLFHDVDIQYVIKFLHMHKLSSAYLYAYSNGLGDCAGAFHSLFSARMLVAEGGASGNSTASALSPQDRAAASGYPSSEQAEIGYRLLLFLEYIGQGKIFPRGDKMDPVPSPDVLWRLLELLVSEKYLSHSSVAFGTRPQRDASVYSVESEMYPFLFALYKVDADALFFSISQGLEALSSLHEMYINATNSSLDSPKPNPMPIDQSIGIVLEKTFAFLMHLVEVHSLNEDVMLRPFFEQCALDIVSCREILSHDLLSSVISYLSQHVKPRLAAEELAMRLAALQSKSHHSVAGSINKSSDGASSPVKSQANAVSSTLRSMLEEAKFYRAAQMVTYWKQFNAGSAIVFGAGLRYYLTLATRAGSRDVLPTNDVVFGVKQGKRGIGSSRAAVWSPEYAQSAQPMDVVGLQWEQPFLFIDDQYRILYMRTQDADAVSSFASVLIGVLPELYELDHEKTKIICRNHLTSFTSEMCEKLRRYPSLLFEVLYAIFKSVTASGDHSMSMVPETNTRGSISISNAVDISPSFTQADMLIFLKLVATLQPHAMYNILRTVDNYSIDEVLSLCKERRVYDATSYLLERMGDSSGALEVVLQEIASLIAKMNADFTVAVKKTSATFAQIIAFKKAHALHLRAQHSTMMQAPQNADEAPQKSAPNESPVAPTTGDDLLDAVIQLSSYKDLLHAINFAVDLCNNNSTKSDNRMWFRFLDQILSERGDTARAMHIM